MKYKLILTDLQTRKTFDVFNICKFNKNEIISFFSGSKFEKKILEFIYQTKIYSLNKNLNFNKQFNMDDDCKYVYFPLEEDTTILFYNFIKQGNRGNFFFKLPPKVSFDIVRNKMIFSSFCITNNISVPNEFNYYDILKSNKIPCNLIIKPTIGSGSVGIKFIDTFEDLLKYKNYDFSNYIIQERLDNSKDIKGAFFLFNEGKLVSYYGHKRIRTYPQEGGVTVYSKCEINDELKEQGVLLLEKLQWSGIAMIEFLYDNKTDSYKIIEVNPRAWGSIMLSEYCGSNMIQNYIRISLGNKIIDTKIKEETYIRWLFPWDVISYIKSKGNIKYFWKFDRKKTCYINFTYTSWYRSVLFFIYNIFDPNKILKLLKKLFK